MDSVELKQILQSLLAGEQSLADSERLISQSLFSRHDEAPVGLDLDLDREQRCGYPEVIYAPGKSPEILHAAVLKLHEAGQSILVTRCSAEQIEGLKGEFSFLVVDPIGKTARSSSTVPPTGKVSVISAGSADLPIAREALETLAWMNVQTEFLLDVGVAGPQRFLQQKHRLENSDAIIVVAGMEGALPSVVGGWVDCPVFAVPTSVGYGAAFSGLTPLLGMLNSCAANVAVVNIDAGFKAGYLAGMVSRRLSDVRMSN